MQFDNVKGEQNLHFRRDILAVAAGIGLIVLYIALFRLVLLFLGIFLPGPLNQLIAWVVLIVGILYLRRASAAIRTYSEIVVSFPFLVVVKVVYKISKRELLKRGLAILNFIVGFVGGIIGTFLFIGPLFSTPILETLGYACGIGIFIGILLWRIPFEAYKQD